MNAMFNFILLPLVKQTQYIYDNGTRLLSRQVGAYDIDLFSLGNFYAEIWRNKEDDRIYAITPFKDVSRLDPYLKEIMLEGISI